MKQTGEGMLKVFKTNQLLLEPLYAHSFQTIESRTALPFLPSRIPFRWFFSPCFFFAAGVCVGSSSLYSAPSPCGGRGSWPTPATFRPGNRTAISHDYYTLCKADSTPPRCIILFAFFLQMSCIESFTGHFLFI